jgi:hypothetical protein
MPPGLVTVDLASPYLQGYSLGLNRRAQDRRDREWAAASSREERRRMMAEEDQDWQAQDRTRVQDERGAAGAMYGDIYNREVLAPQMLDAGDDADYGTTVDRLGSLMNAGKLFGEAPPEAQRDVLGPALGQQRTLARQQQLASLKYQMQQKIMEGKAQAIISSDMPEDEKERALIRLQSGLPIDMSPDSTLSLEEWANSPARAMLSPGQVDPTTGQLTPGVADLADSYVKSTGRFPPTSYFRGALRPPSTNAMSFTAARNPEINKAEDRIELLTKAVKWATDAELFGHGTYEDVLQAQQALQTAYLDKAALVDRLNQQAMQQAQQQAAPPAPPQPTAQGQQGRAVAPPPANTPPADNAGVPGAAVAPAENTPPADNAAAEDDELLNTALEEFRHRYGRNPNAGDREALRTILLELAPN